MKRLLNKLTKIKNIPCINLICILALIPILRIIMPFAYDNDFWFTINQGRYVIEYGFPIKAIGTIHNLNFLYQSWGSGVLFYLIYHYLGKYGIVTLLIIVMELISYFFYKLCFTVSNNRRLSLIISIIVMVLYNIYFFNTRPHIFTTLNLVLMFYLLEKYLKTLNKKYLYLLPLISLLQINMHGIYLIVLLVIISPYLINSFQFKFGKVESSGYSKKALFFIFIIMLMVSLINPYGYKTIIYGFSSYGSSSIMNNIIFELLAPNFHQSMGKLFISVIILLYVLYFSSKKNIPIRYYLLLIGTSYLALDANKSFWLFIVSSFFPLTFIFKDSLFAEKEIQYSKRYYFTQYTICITVAIVIILNLSFAKLPDTHKFADYLDSHVEDKQAIKLYTGFNEGSYLEWRGYNCYIDPRAEIFLKSNNHTEDIMEEYHNVDTLKLDYREFIEKYQFDYMLFSKKDETLYHLFLINPLNYQNVLEDENYVLYQKGE